MKTNIIKYISLSVMAIAIFGGCVKMDQQPTNKFTDDAFWTSVERAEMVVNMAYSQMYGDGKMWSDEYLGDNMIAKRDRNPDERQIRGGLGNTGLNIFRDEWKWAYGGLKTCNVFMDKVDLVPNMDPAKKQALSAQIRFIRAYLYFRLSNFYGAVPFFLKDITLEESKTFGRTPRATILASLHSELEQIIPQLPLTVSATENGRIRRAAAVMLKARMYMYENNMAETAKLCGELIEGKYGTYELFQPNVVKYSAYEDLFTSANEYNKEIILCYSMIPMIKEWSLNDKAPHSSVGSMGAYFFPTESLVSQYTDLDGKPYTVKGNDPYSGRDPRLDATVVHHGSIWRDVKDGTTPTSTTISIDPSKGSGTDTYKQSNATETGYYLRKWFDPAHRTDLKVSTNIIMMRYADVLLMYAEAFHETEASGMTEDVWNKTIRPIRVRAGFTQNAALDFPSGKTKTEMQEIIRRERRSELAMEGLRYYDIIRWNEGTKLLDGPLYSAKFTENAAQDLIFTYTFNNNRDIRWAVPQSELNNWTALKPQNSGY